MAILRSWLLLLLVLLFPLTGTAGVAHLPAPVAQVQPCLDSAPGRVEVHQRHAHAAPDGAVEAGRACCMEDPSLAGCNAPGGDGCPDCAQCPGAGGGNAFTMGLPVALVPPTYASRGHWPAQAGRARAMPERLERPPRAG